MLPLEGLEVDQYMWGILNQAPMEVEEVTIDSSANWKAKKSSEEDESKRLTKAMSPGSTNLPTMNSWMDMNQAMSPYMPSPDMNTIASGSMMNGSTTQQSYQRNPGTPTSGGLPGSGLTSNDLASLNSGQNDYSSPLSHLADHTNSLDHLSALDKSLTDQVTIAKFLKIISQQHARIYEF